MSPDKLFTTQALRIRWRGQLQPPPGSHAGLQKEAEQQPPAVPNDVVPDLLLAPWLLSLVWNLPYQQSSPQKLLFTASVSVNDEKGYSFVHLL